jgi:galacturonosyltransferase
LGVLRLKILVLSNSAGGLYHFRSELLETLLGEGYDVFFCVPDIQDAMFVQLLETVGCTYIHTPMSRRGVNPIDDIMLVRQYQRVVKDVRPDVILSYTIKPNLYGSFVAARARIPIIMNITGLGSALQTGKLKSLVTRMYRYAGKHAAVVFFQNKANMDWFLTNRLVAPEKTRLIPGSGVNLEKFRPLPKINDDGVVRFLFIGRIMRDKGIEEYLAAAARIRRRHPYTEFQIVGSYEEERYREWLEGNDDVRYLGRSGDVREQIREADCIVHPSHHEGMSNVLLEGAAMGKPLMASNIPGCREVIDEGVNGFVVEPGCVDDLVDKLEIFLSMDRNKWVNMGMKSREKVEREFDRNIVVNAYLEAIEEILSQKGWKPFAK